MLSPDHFWHLIQSWRAVNWTIGTVDRPRLVHETNLEWPGHHQQNSILLYEWRTEMAAIWWVLWGQFGNDQTTWQGILPKKNKKKLDEHQSLDNPHDDVIQWALEIWVNLKRRCIRNADVIDGGELSFRCWTELAASGKTAPKNDRQKLPRFLW